MVARLAPCRPRARRGGLEESTQLPDDLTETSPQHHVAVMTVCVSARYSQRAMNGLQHTGTFVVQFRAGSDVPIALTARMRERSMRYMQQERRKSKTWPASHLDMK
jgi:hypothetical protein